ncbi:MAG TPA: hypothetical protein VKC66_30130 [Xanthobacteraceae bacterium]|nr:hypothetical protein [Xanthobacteraceae bacterium]
MWSISFRRFLHHRQRVFVRILEERHPKIMIVHLCDAVRTMGECGATFLKRGDRQCDVGATEIDAALCFELGRSLFSRGEDALPHIEERQVGEPIQLAPPDHVFIKLFSTINISDRKRDLADVIKVE